MTEPRRNGARNILASMGYGSSFFNEERRKSEEERARRNRMEGLMNNEAFGSENRLRRRMMLEENTIPPSPALEENRRPLGLRLRLGQTRKTLGSNTSAQTQKRENYGAMMRRIEQEQRNRMNRSYAERKLGPGASPDQIRAEIQKKREYNALSPEEKVRRIEQEQRNRMNRSYAERKLGPGASPDQIRAEIQKKREYNALSPEEKVRRIEQEQRNRMNRSYAERKLGPGASPDQIRAEIQKKREYNARPVEPPQTNEEMNRIWARQKANMQQRRNDYERFMLKKQMEMLEKREKAMLLASPVINSPARMNTSRVYKTLKRQNGQRNLGVKSTAKKPWFKFW